MNYRDDPPSTISTPTKLTRYPQVLPKLSLLAHVTSNLTEFISECWEELYVLFHGRSHSDLAEVFPFRSQQRFLSSHKRSHGQ
ncbi:hypothetical protein BFJ71_g8410 [Fusarium oxysporum]|nr:hypothetical protein BFJ71_g8410 [Fusarium oxysporum]